LSQSLGYRIANERRMNGKAKEGSLRLGYLGFGRLGNLGIVNLGAQRGKAEAAEDNGCLGDQIGETEIALRLHADGRQRCGHAEDLGAIAFGEVKLTSASS
jgi:hypothetical protein